MTMSLKFIGWPFILALALRRQWASVAAAGGVVLLMNLAAAALMGCPAVLDYYLRVSVTIAPLYRAIEYNFSVWAVGWRLFQGTESATGWGVQAPPLIYATWLAPYVAGALVVLLLTWSAVMLRRAQDFDAAFAALVCCIVVLNPVAWVHYLTLALLPLIILASRLQCRGPATARDRRSRGPGVAAIDSSVRST